MYSRRITMQAVVDRLIKSDNSETQFYIMASSFSHGIIDIFPGALKMEKVPKAIQVIGWIQGVISKERQALVEEIIRGLPKSKGIAQEGLIYDRYTKIGWNDYRNTANEYLLTALNRRRADETNLYTINSASCCGFYPDRLLLE